MIAESHPGDKQENCANDISCGTLVVVYQDW